MEHKKNLAAQYIAKMIKEKRISAKVEAEKPGNITSPYYGDKVSRPIGQRERDYYAEN